MGTDVVGRPRIKGLARPLLVGVTGTIGAGKSVLARAMAASPGVKLLDADRIGHEALRPASPLIPALVRRFGRDILAPGGGVDRRALARKVFASPGRVSALNGVVHPWLLATLCGRIARLNRRRGVAIVVVDAALLCEWGLSHGMDRVVVVDAPPAKRRLWLRERGLSLAQIRSREAAQWPPSRKRRCGQILVSNTGSERALAGRGRRLVRDWLRRLQLPRLQGRMPS